MHTPKKYYVKNETTGEFTEAGIQFDELRLLPPKHGVSIVKYEHSTSFHILRPDVSPAAAMLTTICKMFSEELLSELHKSNKLKEPDTDLPFTDEQRRAWDAFGKAFPAIKTIAGPSMSEVIENALKSFTEKYISKETLNKTAREFYEVDF